MIPLIARTTQEMLPLVPHDLRDASHALGISRWRTIVGIVLPSALGGILTGAVLAIARAAGETAPLLLLRLDLRQRRPVVNVFGTAVPNIPFDIFHYSESAIPGRPRARLGRRARPDRVIILVGNLTRGRCLRASGGRCWHGERHRHDQDDQTVRRRSQLDDTDDAPTAALTAGDLDRGRHATATEAPATTREVVFDLRDLDIFYGATLAVHGVNMKIHKNVITAMIGPSGCGKSTVLRSLNRMNDSIPGFRVTGEVLYHGHDLYASGVDPVEVRRRIGMVFQRPNPFPKSIFDNIAWAPRILGLEANLNERVEKALRGAALWDEVKDRLKQTALGLSGGQQQRLCIARAIAIEPDVLLLDEPASALDPISTAAIEELMHSAQERVHARDRHPQHAAGGARRRAHRVLQPRRQRRPAHRRPRRVRRHRQALHAARRQADRGLRHRPLRMTVRGCCGWIAPA